MQLNFVCVLRSGPEYRVSHVEALASGVRRNLSLAHRFVCLTDQVQEVRGAGIEAIPLTQNWPGWFSKICLFTPGLFTGPTVYLDLDSIIVGNMDGIVLDHHFTMLENFWRKDRVGSGMMAWDCDLSTIYQAFAQSPQKFIAEYSVPEKWGDQAFILQHTPILPERFQTKSPGKVVSYKKHVVPNGGKMPSQAAVCCFHGQPRPWHTPLWNAAHAAS